MSSPAPALRQRKSEKQQKNRGGTPQPDGLTNGSTTVTAQEGIENPKQGVEKVVRSEWEYKLALAVITALAFGTRFWGIGHPDQVVFDEVHFGKVRSSYHARRQRGYGRPCKDREWDEY